MKTPKCGTQKSFGYPFFASKAGKGGGGIEREGEGEPDAV